MKNDIFQKALKSIQEHSRSHSGMPRLYFWRFWAQKRPKWEIQETTKIGPKTQENEKNEVLKTKFSQPTLKNYWGAPELQMARRVYITRRAYTLMLEE